jgi:hypothetical protein
MFVQVSRFDFRIRAETFRLRDRDGQRRLKNVPHGSSSRDSDIEDYTSLPSIYHYLYMCNSDTHRFHLQSLVNTHLVYEYNLHDLL